MRHCIGQDGGIKSGLPSLGSYAERPGDFFHLGGFPFPILEFFGLVGGGLEPQCTCLTLCPALRG